MTNEFFTTVLIVFAVYMTTMCVILNRIIKNGFKLLGNLIEFGRSHL